MPTLAQIRPVAPIRIARRFTPFCAIAVYLHVRVNVDRASATLTAVHQDAEGSFVETMDATPALEATSDVDLFAFLDATAFESGVLATPTEYTELIAAAGALF